MEIERKYLLLRRPEGLDRYPHCDIEQGYLCTSPTLRIRRMGDAYILTVKQNLPAANGAICNREEEFPLSEKAFLKLKAKCEPGWISKTRYRVDLRSLMGDGLYVGLVAEVDLFHGRHQGLELVEVEFPDAAAAAAFIPPDWFGLEVSSDPHYRNSYLASVASSQE